jgi:uncharacterized protein (DUF1330 family)
MAAYLVVETDWKDTPVEKRAEFGEAALPVIQSYRGRLLTPPGSLANEVLEGHWHPKIVTLIEFPDAATVHQMWKSPGFQAAIAIRQATNAVFNYVLVDAGAK